MLDLAISVYKRVVGESIAAPPVPDKYLMEDGTSRWLLEDGTSFWLIE